MSCYERRSCCTDSLHNPGVGAVHEGEEVTIVVKLENEYAAIVKQAENDVIPTLHPYIWEELWIFVQTVVGNSKFGHHIVLVRVVDERQSESHAEQFHVS